MSITEKLTTVAENMPKVFDAGKQTEYDAFWDAFQEGGVRTGYEYGFAGNGWTDENFKPKYDIVPSGSTAGLFRQCHIVDLKQCVESCGVYIDLRNASSLNGAFCYSPYLKVLPKLDCSGVQDITNMFFRSSALETIEEVKFGEITEFKSTFYMCTALTHMIVTGVIGQNGLDLHRSTLLDRESLLSIINILQFWQKIFY